MVSSKCYVLLVASVFVASFVSITARLVAADKINDDRDKKDLELIQGWNGEEDLNPPTSPFWVKTEDGGTSNTPPSPSPAPPAPPAPPAAPPAPPASDAGAVTYAKDIKPIVEGKCTTCHKPGGSKPNPSYASDDQARTQGASIVDSAVDRGSMPPGARLSDGEKALLKKWRDGGYK